MLLTALPVIMKQLKKYAEIIEQSWSTPIDDKMIEYKFQSIDKPKRRAKSSILRLTASSRLPLTAIMKQIKKCAVIIEYL